MTDTQQQITNNSDNTIDNEIIEKFNNLPLFYKGRLNESIQKASTNLDLFVVYVVDTKDDQSEVLKCISHQTVISFVKSKCVLYKILKNSAEFQFLSQHYPNHSDKSCFYFFDINGQVFKTDDLKNGCTFISILSLFKAASDYFDKQKQTLNSPYKIEQKSKERRLVLQKTFCTKPVPKQEQQPTSSVNLTKSTTTTTTTTNTPPIKKKVTTPEPEPYIPNDDYITKAVMTTLIFKLTDGETLKAEFNVNDRLKDIKEFIKNNRTDENRPFEMMTIYPKHIFTQREYEQTLKELNLVPSATITLNPLDVSNKIEKKSSASAVIHTPDPNKSKSPKETESSGSYFSSVKNYFSSFFGALQQPEQEKEKESKSKSSSSKSSSSSSSNGGVKKRTNIHQVNHDDDSDEQKKQKGNWNGNSTQYNG